MDDAEEHNHLLVAVLAITQRTLPVSEKQPALLGYLGWEQPCESRVAFTDVVWRLLGGYRYKEQLKSEIRTPAALAARCFRVLQVRTQSCANVCCCNAARTLPLAHLNIQRRIKWCAAAHRLASAETHCFYEVGKP